MESLINITTPSCVEGCTSIVASGDAASDEANAYTTEITRFAWDAGTPLPLVFHPDGTLYYAIFGGGGQLFTIDAIADSV